MRRSFWYVLLGLPGGGDYIEGPFTHGRAAQRCVELAELFPLLDCSVRSFSGLGS